MLVTNSGIPLMKGNVHALIQKKKKKVLVPVIVDVKSSIGTILAFDFLST